MAALAARRSTSSTPQPYSLQKRATLVNAKIKWVKDRSLDLAVSRDRHLRPAVDLIHAISAAPSAALPAHEIPSRRQIRLPVALPSAAAFMRRHPAIFLESRPSPSPLPSPSRPFRWFSLTPQAQFLRSREAALLESTQLEIITRLRKLLMLTSSGSLPLPAIDQLRFDLGLPLDYAHSILPNFPQYFSLSNHDPARLELLFRDPLLGVSRREMEREIGNPHLGFPMKFTRGFGLKRKWMSWIEEFQNLPYISPYDHAAIREVDSRTDVGEKRIVGLFHELLHLTVGKKTERENFSNLRGSLGLPYKFTKVFGRHPGVFYLSETGGRQTVVLREGYEGAALKEKHPIVEIRERYKALMRGPLEDEEGDDGSDLVSEGVLDSGL